jgi:hypothetical protein
MAKPEVFSSSNALRQCQVLTSFIGLGSAGALWRHAMASTTFLGSWAVTFSPNLNISQQALIVRRCRFSATPSPGLFLSALFAVHHTARQMGLNVRFCQVFGAYDLRCFDAVPGSHGRLGCIQTSTPGY